MNNNNELMIKLCQEETVFRWLTLLTSILFVSTLSFSIRQSGHATNWRTYFTPTEGFLVGIPIRMAIACQFAGIGVAFCLTNHLLPYFYYTHVPFVPTLVRVTAIFTLLMGVGLLYLVLSTLGTNYSMSCDIKANHRLIDFGPYGYMRHPMYTVLCICWASISLISANLLIMISSAVMLYLVMRFRTPIEEEMMLKSFGKQYIEYEKRVPARYFPALSQLLQKKK